MKANELMIGDWVECTYWTPSKQLKVAEIRRIMDDEIKIGVYSGNLVLIFRQSEVKPIPLTPEILEKNGFEDWDGWSIYSPKNTGIEIAWLGTILKIGGECGNLELPAVMYVHQLQHALRLCGIEKTIEL